MTHRYIGTKEVVAWPQLSPTTDGVSKAGYAVSYADGYTSWSPKHAFEAAYRVAEGDGQCLTFGDALHFLKLGRRVARKGWNGRGMFVWMDLGNVACDARASDSEFIGGVRRRYFATGDTGTVTRMPHLCMRAADGSTVTGWLISQADALAEDWCVLL